MTPIARAQVRPTSHPIQCRPRLPMRRGNSSPIPTLRFYSTEAKAMSTPKPKNYAILIGGGNPGHSITRVFKEHLPEFAEYNNLQTAQDCLIGSKEFNLEDIAIFFANGQKTERARTSNTFFVTILNYIKGVPNSIKFDPLTTLKGPATNATIAQEFDRLAQIMQDNDKLWLFVTGHGNRRLGTVLWNEYISTDFLTVKYLKSQLEKLNKNAQVNAVISSCYSGQYLELSSPNVNVLTTAIAKKVSYYLDGEGCPHLKTISKGILEEGLKCNLLKHQASGLQETGNYYSKDSLTHYLESHLEVVLGKRVIEKYIQNAIMKLYNPYTPKVLEVGLFALIIVDPTGLTKMFVNTKFALAIGKSSIPIIKGLAAAYCATHYEKIRKKIVQTKTYSQWFVRYDKKMIAEMQKLLPTLQANQKQISPMTKEEVEKILSDLQKLKDDTAKDEVLSSYHYLYDKAKVFTSYATPQQLEEFVAISKKLMGKV